MAQNWDFSCFFGRFETFPRPFDLKPAAVALSHQGASIREVRNFCRWAGCRDPELLILTLDRLWTDFGPTFGRLLADF